MPMAILTVGSFLLGLGAGASALTCGDVKSEYKAQKCCGNPAKHFDSSGSSQSLCPPFCAQTCGDVKDFYKSSKCCGNLTKVLDSPTLVPSPAPTIDVGRLTFDTIFFAHTNIMPVVNVTIHGRDGKSEPQTLLVDTGSGGMAFCDGDLAKLVESFRIPYEWCAHYFPGGANGYGFNGTVEYNDRGILRQSIYSIMENKYKMPCGDGLSGIFGVAFARLNKFRPLAAGETIPRWNLTAVYETPWPSFAGDGVGWAPECNSTGLKELPSNLQQYLRRAGGTERFGIHWSGKIGLQTGTFYFDDDSLNNPYYNASTAQKAFLDEWAWYSIRVQSISVWYGDSGKFIDESSGNITCNASARTPCIMDTGTPGIVIPVDISKALWGWDGRPDSPAKTNVTGSLEIDLKGVDQPIVQVKFDARELVKSNLLTTHSGGSVTLGFALWKYYYTIFDISGNFVSIVPLQSAR